MFREKERHLQNLIVELGLKVFTQLDDEFVRRQCRTAFDNWRRLIEDAQSVSVMLWIGDGDEVFNWRGNMEDTFAWNETIGFNNLKYGAYPPNRHYETWYARPYIEHPPKVTYRDLQRIIAALRQTAKEMFNIDIRIGETIDAGPEFVPSPFKFERHPEIVEGGPASKFPKSLKFLCCYAQMKADGFPYATFPQGLPEGTLFGTFLGKQFEHLANAVGFDFVWLSNGFGLTHYAWNYLGEVYNGLECHPERAPQSIKNFVSFWKAFRTECPTRPILIRGTNFSIGMDATAHGIDIREIYREGHLEIPSPNPPWGSNNLGLEMSAHLSRISSTPTRAILFRYYINDSWFASVPWYDYYNREPFDIYCPMSAARLNAQGEAETPTEFNVMTANTGYGEMPRTQAFEVIPHIRRAFDKAPDEAGPLVWVYPFSEYQDELHKSDGHVQSSFFGDWFITRAIAGGLPLNTVINTDAFAECIRSKPETFQGRILIVPTPVAADWKYDDAVLDFVKRGGSAIFYGSLARAPKPLLDALNIQNDTPIEGDLDVTLKMAEDTFDVTPKKRPLKHSSHDSDGGITEVLAKRGDKTTQIRAIVAKGSARRVYALVRKPRGFKGTLAWIRGTVPFQATPNSLEPIMFNPAETHDAPTWLRYLLADMGIVIRQHRHDVSTKPAFLFASRSRGSFFFNGHKPDVTPTISLSFPQGAPIFGERQTLVSKDTATYGLDRSMHFECQVFVKQEKESLVSHKEQRTTPQIMRSFTLSGLQDAVVTLFVPKVAIEQKRLAIKKIHVYTIQDPTSEAELLKKLKKKPKAMEEDLKWKVDAATGAVVVERVTGNVSVEY